MYTVRYSKTNHTITIMNDETKRGITMGLVGEEMAVFLQELVSQANKANESEPEKENDHA